jgi:hypothetical protein
MGLSRALRPISVLRVLVCYLMYGTLPGHEANRSVACCCGAPDSWCSTDRWQTFCVFRQRALWKLLLPRTELRFGVRVWGLVATNCSGMAPDITRLLVILSWDMPSCGCQQLK